MRQKFRRYPFAGILNIDSDIILLFCPAGKNIQFSSRGRGLDAIRYQVDQDLLVGWII